MSATIETSYLGFKILVDGEGFTVLGRDGEPLGKVKSMSAARVFIAAVRRAERDEQ